MSKASTAETTKAEAAAGLTEEQLTAAADKCAKMGGKAIEALETYEKLFELVAERGIVIDGIPAGSELAYYAGRWITYDSFGNVVRKGSAEWHYLDSHRRQRLEKSERPVYPNLSISRDKRLSAQPPNPEISFRYGQTNYEGHLSDIEWHLAEPELAD